MEKKLNIQLLVLSLIPLGYFLKLGHVGGISDITIHLYLLCYFFLFYNVIVKKEPLFFFKADIFAYLWGMMMLASLLYTTDFTGGLTKTLKFIFLGLSLLIFLRSFVKNDNDIKKLLLNFSYAALIVELVIVVDFIKKGMPLGRYEFYNVHPVPLTMLGVIVTLLSFILMIYKKINAATFILFLVPSIAIIILGASKGPVISLLITLLMFSFIIIKRIKLLHMFVVIGIGYLIVTNKTFSQHFEYYMTRFERTTTDQSSYERLRLYDEAISLFYKSPVLGNGSNSIASGYPHNLFLEVLAEQGIILAAILLLILMTTTHLYFKYIVRGKADFTLASSLALVIVSLISLMISWSFVDHKYLYFGLGILIIALNRKRLFKDKKVENDDQNLIDYQPNRSLQNTRI